jgi:site-specific DNA-methyltransferase (adenine-specific)
VSDATTIELARAGELLQPGEPWALHAADCLRWLPTLPERSADLVFFSPPYEGQRTYGIKFKRRGQVWVDWMREIVRESARVSRGLVIVNAACPVRDFKYSPALEWLVSDLTRIDGLVCGPSPYAWVKSANRDDALGNGQPGSGSGHYQRRDWEPVYAFCLPDRLPLAWSDNTAFGHTPICGPGGRMSNRKADGRRDRRESQPFPKIANPGNVIRVLVGGGNLGHALAHKSEAPMSLPLAERFVCWFVPPGGIVCDPFAGSGTTLDAAVQHGRRGIGCDIRPEQVKIARARLRTVTPNLFAETPTEPEPQPVGVSASLFDDCD